MVLVCAEYFPMGSYPFQKEPGFYMEPELKDGIDYLIKNISNDWAFTILITGRGEVRVGKSVLAQQIAFYWISEVNRLYKKNYDFDVDKNYVFNGSELIKKGNILGSKEPLTAIVYDEAGADIQGIKIMSKETKDVLDYLRECGQYNMLTLLVLPDYFSLPSSIAMTYSVALIDVSYFADDEGIFQRGFYDFFSRPKKQKLYIDGKKSKNYKAAKPDFRGRFNDIYTVDEKSYRAAKALALKKREKPLTSADRKYVTQRDCLIYLLAEEFKFKPDTFEKYFEGFDWWDLTPEAINEVIVKVRKKLSGE